MQIVNNKYSPGVIGYLYMIKMHGFANGLHSTINGTITYKQKVPQTILFRRKPHFFLLRLLTNVKYNVPKIQIKLIIFIILDLLVVIFVFKLLVFKISNC